MKLARRIDRLEAPVDGRLPLWARRLAIDVAAQGGLEPAAVIQEAEAILTRAAEAGALRSPVRWETFLADEGIDADALVAEAERWVSQW